MGEGRWASESIMTGVLIDAVARRPFSRRRLDGSERPLYTRRVLTQLTDSGWQT